MKSEKCFTKSGLRIAIGYIRIVHGERGSYVEFNRDQLDHSKLFIPPDCKYRLTNSNTYYNEYRTIDKCFVKIYEQKKTVKYADYKIGLWYISENDLIIGGVKAILENL